ncbi:MAG TPA: HupE/UreJ family protein [Candidatus Binatia bacterium]|nr:HupE/UreJ family protein [Candidatus Binatia bacterium]
MPSRLVFAAVAVALTSVPLRAHPLAPALLEVQEHDGGLVAVGWKMPLLRPRGTALAPVLPAGCHDVGPRAVTRDETGVWTRWTADCGPGGLVGAQLGATGFGTIGLGALVRVTLADGRVAQGVVTLARPLLTVPPRPSVLAVVRDYVRLGVEHILTGPDHLLFVFGLLLLAGSVRRLLATVTAFTVGHSVTLSLAALGLVDLPSRPIEVGIATSVLALAVELARPPGPTLMRRRPWAMAAVFGLLHGLGFAAALREAGLPSGDIPLALVSFNTGIELGQLAFVVGVLALAATVGRVRVGFPLWMRRVPVYAMGSLAASWWLERTWALLR